ncbi:MAG TPA: hypothetical protein VF529_09770 [Solirubrobacteraceae bacterium]
MDPRTAIDLPIDVDGARVRSETLQASLSPYVLAIGTTLPEIGVSLYSTYHGQPGAQTVAVHLARAPRRKPQTDVTERDEQFMPVVFARTRCLHDHALRLQEFLGSLGRPPAIHLSDATELTVEAGQPLSPDPLRWVDS